MLDTPGVSIKIDVKACRGQVPVGFHTFRSILFDLLIFPHIFWFQTF